MPKFVIHIAISVSHFQSIKTPGLYIYKNNPNQNITGIKNCSQESKKGHAEKDMKSKCAVKASTADEIEICDNDDCLKLVAGKGNVLWLGHCYQKI